MDDKGNTKDDLRLPTDDELAATARATGRSRAAPFSRPRRSPRLG